MVRTQTRPDVDGVRPGRRFALAGKALAGKALGGKVLGGWLAGKALAGWLAVFAIYALVVAVATRGTSSAWGEWAAAGYGVGALVALRWRDSITPLLIGLAGAVIIPARGWPGSGEPGVVARAAVLLLHHGSPYLPSGQLLSAASYNPYLPAMSIFGLPQAAGLRGLLGDPAWWLAAASVALTAAVFVMSLPPRAWRRGPGRETVARNTAFALLSPVLALPIALGTTDAPVTALVCLALACANRPAKVRPAKVRPAKVRAYPRAPGDDLPRPGRAASRWITWTGLAAVAIGTACAMKAVAWPALPVIAAMVAAREGARAAARFATVAVSTALVLIAAFAPAFLSQPAAFADNLVAYPLGLAHHETPAASPLPGHLLASIGSAGRLATLGLLLVAGLAIAVSLVRRPPRDARSAALRLALGLTLLFTLAPAARFGYFSYPAALLGWLALTGQARPGAGPGALPLDLAHAPPPLES
jgi:hypothetical protein